MGQLVVEQPAGVVPPAAALGEPRERAAGHQLPGGFGDHVVVGRRAPAAEGGEEPLVPVDLVGGDDVLLEEGGRAGPAFEQPPGPDPRDQADAELDAAAPVDPLADRVGAPPRAEVGGHQLGVPVVAGQPPGAGQDGQVVVAGELPDLLDVPRVAGVAVVDVERGAVRRERSPADRIDRPRRRRHVVADGPEDLHVPVGDLSGRGDHPFLRRRRQVVEAGQAGRREQPDDPGLLPDRRGRRPEAAPGPRLLQDAVLDSPADLRRRHALQAPGVPAESRVGHRRSTGVTA